MIRQGSYIRAESGLWKVQRVSYDKYIFKCVEPSPNTPWEVGEVHHEYRDLDGFFKDDPYVIYSWKDYYDSTRSEI